MLDSLLNQYHALDGVRLNAVTNLRLEFTGKDGSSRSISNANDRELLKHLRSLSTKVITDVATAQAESYRPSTLVEIEVWSHSGNFRGFESVAESSTFKPFTVLQVQDPAKRLAELRQEQQRVLLETGPTLTRIIAKSRLINEVCLSVTGVSSETQGLRIANEWLTLQHLSEMQLFSSFEIENTLFVRFRQIGGVA